jgi:TNF receptor-associated factor 4
MAVSDKTGFDCEFIEKPSKGIQPECPICLQVLREPYQATCCGKSFCKECIDRIKAANQACPTCNKGDFTVFPNLGLQQALYDFHVSCMHKTEGCEWTGELRALDNHINSDPPADKYLDGCPFMPVNCPSCTDCKLLRKDVKDHLCDNINGFVSRIVSIKQENAQLKVQMDNNEGEKRHLDKRVGELEEKMGEHNRKINMLESKREDLEKEVKERNDQLSSIEGVNQYLQQQVEGLQAKVKDKNREFEMIKQEMMAKLNELDEKNREFEATIQKLRNSTIASSPPSVQPSSVSGTYRPNVEFTMTDFDEWQKDDDMWVSPHFYTHSNGYKMCLCVFANGYFGYGAHSHGTHLSVCVLLMKGEFDDNLKWPFCGVVCIKLMNQEEHRDHVIKEAHCPSSMSIEGSGRVINAERSCFPWGLWKFLPLAALQPKYLKNNCIKLQVQKVEIF